MREIVSLFLATTLIAGALSTELIIGPVKADTITVPDDYATIQEAIDYASDKDTIFVKSGMYSPIVIDKSVNLIGEDKLTIPVDVCSYRE